MRPNRTLTLLGMAGAALLSGVSPGIGQYVPPPQLVGGVDYSAPNYANSPILRKFVDPLPGLGAGGIPMAVADTTKYANSAYYEIALVDYRQQLHSDLAPTTLRGYVQIYPPGTTGAGAVPLNDLNGNQITYSNLLVFAYSQPTYLGPVIVATKGIPTRIKFYNLLPTGAAGDLFIPTDVTIMGAGKGPDGTMFSQNRATLHLHGGDNPWISDGTAHQWITPANDPAFVKKGASQQNVPDMTPLPVTGDGTATFYWPNGLGGRLMFYHDHAFGITRLNVYAGEAAGYLLVDPSERAINTAAGITAELPLVIQDKTFVWGTTPATLNPTTGFYEGGDGTWATDPLWASNPKWGQTPGSLWFPHVYVPNQNPNDLSGANPVGRWDYGGWFWPVFPSYAPPQTTHVPESFMDTPLINGKAYPYLDVNPTVYRFRILNACNDRFLNLQFYAADPTNNTGVAGLTEVRMIPAVKGDGNAAGAWDSLGGTPVPWPGAWTAFDTPGMIPDILDGRVGGVPDPSPTLQGPKMIQIGTEGGILPAPVVLENVPVGYVQNKRDIVIGNISAKTLLLGPAERADVIVDFSQHAGKTLILYSDSPAPVPAGDPRLDYFTGNLDYTANGGAPSTQPGFGPNTRTLMQIRVGGTANGTAFDPASLTTPVANAFAATQDPPIVPLGSAPGVNVARISDTSLTFNGSTTPLQPKAIQELFDWYGRMNSTLGVEVPFTTALIQTTIPLGFADPPTEVFNDNATQLWKITHNGVDTHAIHFHLFNVQVVNRVGWDGAIRLPDANEAGWKETVKMNPLEDCIVALHAKIPTVPFQQPNSVRPLAPEAPLGATLIPFPPGQPLPAPGVTTPVPNLFFGVDPANNPVAISNIMANFGHEYTWHCHLLGHEENDMMRPTCVAVPPATPILNGFTVVKGSAVLTWTDASPDETAYMVQKRSGTGPWTTIATVPGGTMTYTDTTYKPNQGAQYQVIAVNTVGSGVAGYPSVTAYSLPSNVAAAPLGATTITSVTQALTVGSPVVLKWTYSATDQTGFQIQRSTSNTFPANSTTTVNVGNVLTYSDASVVVGLRRATTYFYRVAATNAQGTGAFSNIASLLVHP